MKRWTLVQFGMLLGCSMLSGYSPALAFVYENTAEFQAAVDCDGDGRLDAVIVDKASGSYRIGYQTSAGVIAWSDSRSSGMNELTGFTAGSLLYTNVAALAFTAPQANRAHILDVRNPGAAVTNYTVYSSGIGPSLLIAVDISMSGNTPADDLIMASTQNDPATGVHSSNVLHFIQSSNQTFQSKFISATTDRWVRGNRFTPRAGATNMTCVIMRTNGQDRLRIAPGSYVIGAAGSMTPYFSGEYDYAVARFGSQTNVSFLLYAPGSTQFRRYPVNESSPNVFTLGSSAVFAPGMTIGQLFVVSAQGSNQLLVISADGLSAACYAFDGVNAPVLRQTNFSLSPGAVRFTGALPVSETECLLFSGSADGISTAQERFAFTGGLFVSQGTQSLPTVMNYAYAANVFAYQGEPFVADDPVRLGRWHAGDWTTNVTAGASVQAKYLTDQGTVQGLRPGAALTVGSTPAGTTHTLGNQPHEAISVFSFDNASGTEISDLRIDPAPGCYSTSLQITLTNTAGAGTIYYRLNNGGWNVYSAPFWIFADTVVAFYASYPGAVKSELSIAAYTFTQSPGEMDSDHDGVPDYVEIGYSLNPVESGLDQDQDGLSDLDEILQGTDPNNADSDEDTFSDLEELRAGTDPNDSDDKPVLPITGNQLSRVEQNASYDLLVTLRPKSYQSGALTYAMPGVQVRAYNADGGLLAMHAASNLSWLAGFTETNASAHLQNIPVKQNPPFTVVATEPNYPIRYGLKADVQGREMLAVYPDPDLSAVTVSNTWAGGDVYSESVSWADAARVAYSNTVHQRISRPLSIYDTLTALLFERELGLKLYERGAVATAQITLFPFRTADINRTAPGSELLLALENESVPGAGDAWLLKPMLDDLAFTVTNSADSRIRALRSTAAQVYNVSSQYSASNPGVFQQPVDVLRTFLRTGKMDAAYTNVSTFTNATLVQAAAGAELLLDATKSRTLDSFVLEYRTNSQENGVITLWTADATPNPKQLYSAPGKRYVFPQFFELLPGMTFQVTGYTDLDEDCAPADPIQVTGIVLTSIPTPVADGSTGTNLPSAWQLEMFGSDGHDALADDDGDGFCNLHEYLAATHAGNSNSTPEAFEFYFERGSDGVLHMEWEWWEHYVSNFVFEIQSAASPMVSFTDLQSAEVGAQSVQLDPTLLSATNLILRMKVSPRRD